MEDKNRSAARKRSGVTKKPADEKSSFGMISKALAGVFGAVVAPILVAVGVKHFTNSDANPSTAPNLVAPGPGNAGKDPVEQKPSPPAPVLSFNGKNLTGFYPCTAAGRGNDPKGIFTVINGELRVSGEEPGYLATEKGYVNYNLIAEYRWGEKTWPPREEAARTAAIIVHANGPDGLDQGLVKSFTISIQEGRTGDIILPKGAAQDVKGYARIDPSKTKLKKPIFQYLPNGSIQPVGQSATILQLNHDLDWKNIKGFRSRGEVEKATGEWNTLTIGCTQQGPGSPKANIMVGLNGTQVNGLYDVPTFRGKVLIRSNGAEIFFRKLELVPRLPPK